MSERPPRLDAETGRRLVEIARRALLAYFHLDTEEPPEHVEAGVAPGGLFATLERGGKLRGCIGYLSPEADLSALVKRAAVAAAVEDPRFPRVTPEELPELRIRLSILSPPTPLESPEAIEIGRHGLIVERDGARGLLLPRVASGRGWDAHRFLAETCRKAGLPPEAYRDPRTRVSVFESFEIDEAVA